MSARLERMRSASHVAVVGAVPPPLGGQALMTAELLRIRDDRLRFAHVNTQYNRSFKGVGQPSIRKVRKLIQAIAGTLRARALGFDILYFCPAGKSRTALWRDAAFLLATRPFFRKTVLHFHAGGSAEYIRNSGKLEQSVLRRALSGPDVAIKLCRLSPSDPEYLQAKDVRHIPNGIPDPVRGDSSRVADESITSCHILIVALVCRSKGFDVLIDALAKLSSRFPSLVLDVVGQFQSDEYEADLKARIDRYGLSDHVVFHGEKAGAEKCKVFEDAHVYCFPSFFEHENLPVSVIEAMAWALPVVASNWRGIPSLVSTQVSGFVVRPNDADSLAESLDKVISDTNLRLAMGRQGRARFECDYRVENYRAQMAELLSELRLSV